jgi:hypothetical protein
MKEGRRTLSYLSSNKNQQRVWIYPQGVWIYPQGVWIHPQRVWIHPQGVWTYLQDVFDARHRECRVEPVVVKSVG